jgi:L-arabinonolactonase
MDEEHDPHQPLGSFYHWDVERGPKAIHGGVAIANGLCFSPDGLTIHYADSPRGTIWRARYDPDTGTPHDERVFVGPDPDVPGDTGSPDGSAVDETGCVWNARWGAWGIARFTPEGVLDTIIDVPVPQPSAVTFGGDDLDTLYITTAREHMRPSDPRYELSGALFAVTPGVTGIADTPVRV